MILIGLAEKQKQHEIVRYVSQHSIDNIIVFSDEHFFLHLPDLPHIRQIGYRETIMYRTFYPLLEEIDGHTLLVYNEMMRDADRSCLTYNCCAKYSNQTPHTLVFEYLPIISEPDDLMILVDFDTAQRHKGFHWGEIDRAALDIRCVRRRFTMDVIEIPASEKMTAAYIKKRDSLFDNIGNKDPDTIPRNLHIWCGRYKTLDPDKMYVARNARFKRKNVTTYANVTPGTDYIMVDIPHARKDVNDFLRRTGMTELRYISTGFGIDQYYISEFENWVKEVEKIYAQTGLYTEDS